MSLVDFILANRENVQFDIYFQNHFPIYLLGHKIFEGGISKNSKEDRLANKTAPLSFSEWFERSKNYDAWN